MDILNLLIVVLSSLLFLYSTLKIYNISNSSPIPILVRFLSLSSLLCFFASLSLIPLTFPSDTFLTIKTSFYFKFAYSSIQIGLFIFVILFSIPDLKLTLRSLGNIILVTVIFSSAIFMTVSNVNAHLVNGKNFVKYDIISITLSGLTMMLFVIYMLARDKKINNIEKKSGIAIKSGSAYKIFSFLLLLILISFLLVRLPGLEPIIPTFTFLLFTSFCYIYICMVFEKIEPFFFISDILIENIVIYEKSTENTIYSKSFSSSHLDESFSTMIASLHNPIKQLLQSQAELDQISFADKTVLLDSGKYVVSVLIVSRSNIIIQLLLENVTKIFEKRYSSDLSSMLININSTTFNDFDEKMHKISQYFLQS